MSCRAAAEVHGGNSIETTCCMSRGGTVSRADLCSNVTNSHHHHHCRRRRRQARASTAAASTALISPSAPHLSLREFIGLENEQRALFCVIVLVLEARRGKGNGKERHPPPCVADTISDWSCLLALLPTTTATTLVHCVLVLGRESSSSPCVCVCVCVWRENGRGDGMGYVVGMVQYYLCGMSWGFSFYFLLWWVVVMMSGDFCVVLLLCLILSLLSWEKPDHQDRMTRSTPADAEAGIGARDGKAG